MGGLTARQRSFALELAICGVALTAAKNAGYSPGGIRSQANRLVQNEAVMSLVAVHRDKLSAKVEAAVVHDAAWVIRRHAEIAEKAEGLEQMTAASKAIECIGKALGIYVEKQEISGPGGSPIVTLDVLAMTDAELQRAIAEQEKKPLLTLGGGNGKKNNGAAKHAEDV